MKRFMMIAALAACPLWAHADESDIRRSVKDFLGGQDVIQSISKTPFPGLNEVVLQTGEIIYTDDKGSFILNGELIDPKRRISLTADRQRMLEKIDFATLPLGDAIKTVRGNGKRVIASFEDPNCGYCKRFAKELQAMNNVTIYTFLFPILSPDSGEKSKNIWCAKDRSRAWNDWMLEGKPVKEADCKTPLDQNLALGQKLRISGTPTIFLSDGSRVKGMLSAPQLEQELAQIDQGKGKARKN
ncbi:MAG: DsbC family protein [Betaproteobacteria bacterium]|nr:DsbC family protein [Betaproteobacteria bacterium]